MSEKIISRILSASTGEEYVIGVRGSSETLFVQLEAETTVDFTQLKVIVTTYGDTTQTFELIPDANGLCTMSIEFGTKYSVQLPALTTDGYNIVATRQTYIAALANREINYFYSKDIQYENVVITCSFWNSEGGVLGAGDGEQITLNCTDGTVYNSTISNDVATFNIPYGKSYTVDIPTLDSYLKTPILQEYHASIAIRNITAYYRDYQTSVVYGKGEDGSEYYLNSQGQYVDVSGNVLTTEQASSRIRYISFNPQELAESFKQDGTQGCGLMFDTQLAVVSRQWAVENISYYDETDVVGSPYLTYCNTHQLAYEQADGQFLSGEVLRVAPRVHADYIANKVISGVAEPISVAPAFEYAASQLITVNGETKSGFVPSYKQLYLITVNYTLWQQAWSALGKNYPTVKSGHWWSSCQFNAAYAVSLYSGGFSSYVKTNSYSVLVGFDL